MNIDVLLPYFVVGFMLFMFAGFTFAAWQKRGHDVERIRQSLVDKGYRNIAIRYEWFDFDRSNSTYTIECVSPVGKRITTSCKIHRAPGWDEDLYWKDPL